MIRKPPAPKPKISRFTGIFCLDCNQPDFGYMVKESVWKKEAGLGKEIICLDCLEKRIDRPLQFTDFTDAPINRDLRKGYEMGYANGYAMGKIHGREEEDDFR